MAAIERYRIAYQHIAAGQREEFTQMAERVFAPNEITRDDTYLLPPLAENKLFGRTVNYESALKESLRRLERVRLLDLGCGAGFWVEQQAKRNPRLDVYGVTAKDYRQPDSRPPVVHTGDDHLNGPIFKSPDGSSIYLGIELNKTAAVADDHYLVGDIHAVLATLPTNFFHLVVSYQTCRYLFDPLRVLKQIYRSLAPNGYAFLESFTPQIFDRNENPISDQKIRQMFLRGGYSITWGKYRPTEFHVKNGLAIKKTKNRLVLPIKYRQVVSSSIDKTRVITYELT